MDVWIPTGDSCLVAEGPSVRTCDWFDEATESCSWFDKKIEDGYRKCGECLARG